MKWIIPLYVLFLPYSCVSQKQGFESLSYAKTSLESIIKEFGSTINDSSGTYRKYYISLSKQYNNAKANYEAQRCSMKDCILNNNSQKKIKKCWQSKQLNVQNSLDSLQSILDAAYI